MILETDRLILRPIDPAKDFDAFADCYSDADTMRYLTGSAMTPAQAWRSMAMVIGHEAFRGYTFLSCIEKSTGAWVGRVGPWFPMGWPQPEIGWVIHPDHRRKGFAREAGRACIDYAYETLGWDEVVHCILDGNIGSMKTAESLGSKRLYSMDGIPGLTEELCWVYGQSRP